MTKEQILQTLQENFGIIEDKSWVDHLTKTLHTKNITIDEWNAIVLKVASNSGSAKSVYDAILNTLSTVDIAARSVWIRYSSTPGYEGSTETWSEGQNYMGVAVSHERPSVEAYTWIMFKGDKGPQGDRGDPFSIANVYDSVEDMENATDVPVGSFVIVSTEDPYEEDNGKLFLKGPNGFKYITDMSGSVLKGEPGANGKDGIDGKDGVTPQLKILARDNMWYVSYDNGVTWSSLGITATGPKGENGKNGNDGPSAFDIASRYTQYSDERDWLATLVGPPGAKGSDGKNGITPILKIENNVWHVSYDNEATWASLGVAASGSDGIDGKDGLTPKLRINSGTNEWAVSYDNGITWASLGVVATGTDGIDGLDGIDGITPLLKISDTTNVWMVSYDNGASWQSLGVVAAGKDGKDGVTPIIDSDGYWIVNGEKTEYKAVGEDGITPTINEEGYWVVDGDLTDYRATGKSAFEIANEYADDKYESEQEWVDSLSAYTKTVLTTDGDVLRFFVGTQAEYDALANKDNLFAIITDDPNKPLFDKLVSGMVTQGLAYTLSDDGTSYICSGLGTVYPTDIDLNIPFTYNNLPVTGISAGAFKYTSITSVTIPNSVTSIGDDAFRGCLLLKSAHIGDGVTTIGENAFRSCSKLSDITIGDSLTAIGDNAFYDCISIKSIDIGDSVTNIGDSAFYNCWNLRSMVIGNNVTSIGNIAFSGCHTLKNLTIGNGVTSIGSRAFEYCKNLESVRIPYGITSIPNMLFRDCTRLKSIDIPRSVTLIASAAFLGCTSLEAIAIPDTVTQIEQQAFEDCTALRVVYIPKSVATMGTNIFKECSNNLCVVCEASLEPEGWNDSWKGNGSIRVYWGESEAPTTYKAVRSLTAVQDVEGRDIVDTYAVKGTATETFTTGLLTDHQNYTLTGMSRSVDDVIGCTVDLVLDFGDHSWGRIAFKFSVLWKLATSWSPLVHLYKYFYTTDGDLVLVEVLLAVKLDTGLLKFDYPYAINNSEVRTPNIHAVNSVTLFYS